MKRRVAIIVALAAIALSGCSGSAKATGTSTPSTATSTSRPASPATSRPPTTHPTTATTPVTTPPSGAPHAATSASFVSPQQGFALEQSGQVDRTADGGATWHRAGTIGIHGTGEKIRFIDPADGFAFGPNAGAPRLLITHDAGAHWFRLDPPFGAVADLEISRGMIYATAFPKSNTGSINIGIWSTPVEHLVWKQDPLTLQLGAGPVPSAQLVLSFGHGWILNQDRTVISGAQLSTNGQWQGWTPPCLTVNGPAYLTASTGTDLVATCNEGVWGPPAPATTVYFSHDGGKTFARHTAPGFGPVASPNPSTAVVATNTGLQRTTDDGAAWSVVYNVTDPNVSDLGFTTSMQGFVILGNGTMLMTHDAGATWQPVTRR